MSRLHITQVRSTIGGTAGQRAIVRSLGLKRIRHTVVQEDRPEIRGMLRKIPHLVQWEFVDSELTAATDTEAGQSIVAEPEPAPVTPSQVETSADVAQTAADTDTVDPVDTDTTATSDTTDEES